MSAHCAGKVVIVTGGNKGIGLEICRRLLGGGASVILAARSQERGEAACEELRKENPGCDVQFAPLDLASSGSIDDFVSALKSGRHSAGVDVLVNNGAIAFKDADPTPFGQQARPTFQTNYFGTKELTEKVLPLIKPGGVVSTVASMAGTMSLQKCSEEVKAAFLSPALTTEALDALATRFITAAEAGSHAQAGFANSCYGMSKLCIIAYAQVLARAMEADGSCRRSFSSCPGYCNTDMSSHKGPRPAFEGADTPAWLALSPGEAKNGCFYQDRKMLLDIKL